jgi:probable phosphoglycerate mutase
MLIDFIRHGEPEGGRVYRGHGVDDPLSETGWAQMWMALGEGCPWTQIVSSPLRRCRAFAECLAARHGLSLMVDERLREVGFGAWEGRTPDEIRASNPGEYAAFFCDPVRNRPPGAESLEAFFARVAAALGDVAREYADRQVLMITHAGVIRAVLAHVLGADPAAAYRIRVHNAGMTRFRVGEQGLVLEFHNRRAGCVV